MLSLPQGFKNVGLWHVDGKMPNVALMKISAWLKSQGFNPVLQRSPDKLTRFASVIFPENKPMVEFLAPEIIAGGTGWDLDTSLPPEVEGQRADYELYEIDYGIGFLSRGCIRNCPWCVVPRKEGRLRQVAQIPDLVNGNHLILLDNNILALPNIHDLLKEMSDRNLTVNFNQGIDIRLVTPDIANLLSRVHYRNWKNTGPTLHFAFDSPSLEKLTRRGIKYLFDAGIPPSHLMCYVLVGYNTSFDEDLYRCNILRSYNIQPYVMRYNQVSTPELNALARWANAPAGMWRQPFEIYQP